MTKATRKSLAALAVTAILLAAAQAPGQAAETQAPVARTRAEVEALIKEVGSKSPEWWDSVTPRYPKTLDLNWPLKPVGKWNANRNMGQFIWDITKHKERQFYSAFTDTPNQIIAKQSIKGVDAVTGATMTSEAIINAAAKALAGAMK